LTPARRDGRVAVRHPQRRRSAIAPLWRELRTRFREGRTVIGPQAWRAWLLLMAGGVAALLLLMVVLMKAAQRLLADGRLDWETEFLLRLGESGPFSFADAVFFQTFGTDTTLVILLAATAGIACWMRRPVTALSIILAPLVVDIVGRVGWAMWERGRPDVLYDGLASPGFHSFPSGHTSKSVAAYGFLALLWIAASRSIIERTVVMLLLLGIIVVVPLGRMTMGVHWPSDIAGGFILGVAWVAVLRYGLRYERRAAQPANSRAGTSPDSAARVAR
jgi:membrane-associated phospholipid phosphatase